MDLRASVRGLVRQPGFTAAVVLTFALGIGANAALFGIVDRLLLRPPALIDDADQVIRLEIRRDFLGRTITSDALAWDDYKDFEEVDGFAGIAAYSDFNLTLGEGESARRIAATYAAHDLFDLLGVQPHLGRFYGADEDAFGAPLVAVIGYELWVSQFGADPGIVGTTVQLAGSPYTIVGVAPRGFTGVDLARVDAWLPILPGKVATDGDDRWFSGRGWNWVRVAARLNADVAESASLAQATALHRAGHQDDAERGDYDPEAEVIAAPLVAALGPDAPPEGRVAIWLGGVSLLVLLIACANVANLLLARSLRHHRESAVRLALGISPWRLVEQRVLDTLVLAALGGAVGLAVAHWGGAVLRTRLLPNVDWTGASDSRVLAFTAGISCLAGLVAALAPAALAARQRLTGALSQGARSSRSGGIMRNGLTLGQASLATILLVGAGLFVRSMSAARSSDLGFDVDQILAVDLEPSSRLGGVELKAFYQRAAERAATVPRVEAAGATTAPFGWSFGTPLRAEGLDSIPIPPTGGPYYHRVTDGYFDAMGLRVLRGRALATADFGGEPVTVLNQTMADLLWPGEDPLGRCLFIGDRDENTDIGCTRVVGVTEYANLGALQEEEAPQYYLTLTDSDPLDPRGLVVRAGGDPQSLVAPLVRALLTDEAGVRLVRARPMRELMDPEFRGWKLGMTVFTIFGLLALAVAAVGLYSMLAFDVAERRREIGIRLALGSSTERIHGRVLGRSLLLASAGVALGLIFSYVLAPRAAQVLYQISPHDPMSFGVAALVLLVAAGAAGILPARRATRVEPTEALKVE